MLPKEALYIPYEDFLYLELKSIAYENTKS